MSDPVRYAGNLGWPRLWLVASLCRFGDLCAEVGQCPVQQAGYVHLGDSQAVADLLLGEVAVEPPDQDALFALGEIVQVGADGFDVGGVGQVRIVLAECVGEHAGIVAARQRRIE